MSTEGTTLSVDLELRHPFETLLGFKASLLKSRTRRARHKILPRKHTQSSSTVMQYRGHVTILCQSTGYSR